MLNLCLYLHKKTVNFPTKNDIITLKIADDSKY